MTQIGDLTGEPDFLPPEETKRLLTDVLKRVSRSFYMSLRVLPHELQTPVGLAYLLGRTLDTIADIEILPVDVRLRYLRIAARQIDGSEQLSIPSPIVDMSKNQVLHEDSRELLRSFPQSLALLSSLNRNDAREVRQVVATLVQGMEIDLTILVPKQGRKISGLVTWEDLDDYLYKVAGCVGAFWTSISTKVIHFDHEKNIKDISRIGVRLGKALQMTNILRDVAYDGRLGRCYIPQVLLRQYGLDHQDVIGSNKIESVDKMMKYLLLDTLDRYSAAGEYLSSIPRRYVRLRLSVIWPSLIGLSTLALLASNARWFDDSQVVRVKRSSVYLMVISTLLISGSNSLMNFILKRVVTRTKALVRKKNRPC